jgi:cyclophilin family peptidyl-prolyl cis-trans isomerase/protein-disulfide isomerase
VKNQDNEFNKSPFEILQIAQTAEEEVIHAAYKSLAKKYHPDTLKDGTSEERMKELNWAYKELTDAKRSKKWFQSEYINNSDSPDLSESSRAPDVPETYKPQTNQTERSKRTWIFAIGSIIFIAILVASVIGLSSNRLSANGSDINELASGNTDPTSNSQNGLDSVTAEDIPTPPTCIPNPPPPQPSEADLATYTPDPERDWIKGPEDAAITIIEYADFQCPYCSVASQNLKILLEKYPEDVRIVYRHFPLASIHDKAIPAAQAVEAAGLQSEDAFWAFHDLLYETQGVWSAYSIEDFEVWLVEVAEELGLDPVQFQADYSSEEIVTYAESTWTEGQALGIPGTPYLKINSLYDAQADPNTLIAYVELIKLESQQFTECPPLAIDQDAQYLATVETEQGSFVIELFADVAPLAVNSFIYLAENGWFDGVTFHRVLPGFVAQTGDPTGTGYGNPGYRFGNEVDSDLVFDRAGLVAMANSGPDSNGSQFFITYDAAPNLNGDYTIFGEVIEGMEVVESITPRDPQQGVDLPPGDLIVSVTVDQQ